MRQAALVRSSRCRSDACRGWSTPRSERCVVEGDDLSEASRHPRSPSTSDKSPMRESRAQGSAGVVSGNRHFHTIKAATMKA